MKKNDRQQGRRPAMDGELLSLMKLVDGNRFSDIEIASKRILSKRPNNHLATKALTFSLIGLSKYEDALPILEHALKRWPLDAELHNNRGIVLSSLMRWNEALADFKESLRITPGDPEVLKNLGLAYGRMRRWKDAIPPLLEAIENYPGDYVDAIEALAMSLSNSARLEEAVVCYGELWKSAGDRKYLYELFSVRMRTCDWPNVDQVIEELRVLSEDFQELVGNPFVALFSPGVGQAQQKRIAAAYASDFVPAHLMSVVRSPATKDRTSERLRIGYLSADFRVHPVGYVLPRVIELHNRRKIEAIAYSVGPDDGSDARQRFVSAFDSFVDAKDMPVRQLADRIRSDEIDILVDLNGWTTDGRPEVLALRCAPIQVNWLGYAGTMGNRQFADYLIGDRVVTPLSSAECFTETLAQMPHCYLPVDDSVEIQDAPTRSDVGLPEDSFVFCSLNSAYKFNPQVLDLWCKILVDTPGSCLWLSMPPAGGDTRIRAEVATRGVSPERIIFARRVGSRFDHLARISLADLALDPFPYNSHSTGAETLLSGVPMLSLLGDTFPGRVGASLLYAAGLDALVAHSVDNYHEIAVTISQDRDKLGVLRERLRGANKLRLPLFDMRGFVDSLESLYFAMWNNYLSGREPTPIEARLLNGVR